MMPFPTNAMLINRSLWTLSGRTGKGLRLRWKLSGVFWPIGKFTTTPCLSIFYPSANPEEQIFPNAYKGWSDKDVLGAAFNLNLLYREPGAFVHNPGVHEAGYI
jgi:hypothetical protein